ncbi:MAG: hypothetical protein M9897_06170 [Brumimicrobium sp.]|nr:hypothetical protein [Brumimicrobium sp.]
MKVLFAFIISFFVVLPGFTQSNSQLLAQQEEVLSSLLTDLRNTKDDTKIDEANEIFRAEFAKTIAIDSAFYYPFTSLTSIGKIYSQDKLVRIFSWNIQYQADLTNNYCAFILKKDNKRGTITITELQKGGDPLKMLMYETVGPNNWYGALYYDIVDVKKGNKTYYTLLGYDANNAKSAIKFLDVLYFTGKIPSLGFPLFKNENTSAKRVLFEYSARATMSMRYDKSRNKIIMDHLTPEVPKFKEFREFYVPDLSYDAYKWNGSQWELEEDVVAINDEKSKNLNLKAYDAENDTVINIPVKDKWEDPSDVNTPAGSNQHKVALPNDQGNTPATQEKEKSKKKTKPTKYKGVSYTNLGNKKKKK